MIVFLNKKRIVGILLYFFDKLNSNLFYIFLKNNQFKLF